MDVLSELALSVARCGEVPRARVDRRHDCHRIVSSQVDDDRWQVPEAWAGGLATARVVFVSSNPSISLGPPDAPSEAENYPTASWTDLAIASFITQRFDRWATPEGRFRQLDGQLSRPVPFWRRVRDRASELLGREADPAVDYAMTEVVHCKSRGELGVDEAVERCAFLHLERILAACPARLVVVLGARARDHLVPLWRLPPGFGRGDRPGDEVDHQAVLGLAGRDRLVIHLPHPTGMEPLSRFPDAFPASAIQIRTWAQAGRPRQPAVQPRESSGRGPGLQPAVPPAVNTQTRSSSMTNNDDDDVVIVAASNAWPFYRQTAAYVCQPGRSFRGLERVGFYSQRTIHGAVARIQQVIDDVVLSQVAAAELALSVSAHDQRVGDVIAAALAGPWKEGEAAKILLLTPLGDPGTTRFPPIKHRGSSAWTMRQRYTSLSALIAATTTDDLTKVAP